MEQTPRTVEKIYENYELRRNALLRALTTGNLYDGCNLSVLDVSPVYADVLLPRADVEDFYNQCDPERENLCVYGMPTSCRPNLPVVQKRSKTVFAWVSKASTGSQQRLNARLEDGKPS